MRIYWKPSARRRHHLFGAAGVTQAAAAVTFNSRARRRPICVVRTPITPDKTQGNLFTEHEGCHHATPSYIPLSTSLKRSKKRRDARNRKKSPFANGYLLSCSRFDKIRVVFVSVEICLNDKYVDKNQIYTDLY